MTDNQTKSDGGPASAMTLRDRFAERAPEMPKSFMFSKPYPQSAPRVEPTWHDYSSRQDMIQRQAEYTRAIDAAHEEYGRQVMAWEIARLAEWRYAYADAMLAAREARPC